jgi:hypothetical protein
MRRLGNCRAAAAIALATLLVLAGAIWSVHRNQVVVRLSGSIGRTGATK